MGSPTFLIFFYSVVLSLATLSLSLDDVYFEHNCSQASGNYTANGAYQANLNSIVSQLSSIREFNYGFFNLSIGKSPDIVYTNALCRGDINQDRCNICLNYTATKLKQLCQWKNEATAWSEFCLVRYANRNMYGLMENDPHTCVYNENNVSNPDQFNQALTQLLNNLRSKAAAGGPLRKYAADNATTGNRQKLYAMVQCTPDMDEQNCDQCLTFAMSELEKCCSGRLGCRVLRPTCILRFESDYPFLIGDPISSVPMPAPQPLPPPLSPTTSISPTSTGGNSPSPLPMPPSPTTSISPMSTGGNSSLPPPMSPSPTSSISTTSTKENGNNTTQTIIIVIASAVGGPTLIIISICIFKRWKSTKTSTKVETTNEISGIEVSGGEISRIESLQFDFETILVATNNFSDANKLGQGGFGAVYKGILPNEKEIAVKRLSKEANQGDLEFKNEVVLVAKLQHRNLVRLLGFCLEGPERLLIYEFVPNRSLDHFIFNAIQRAQLNWEIRYKIIRGIVRGLLYLHEDSRLRIIHRDLKACNILLDANMNPKIADFGLARLFKQDATHASTEKIAGTYGYMAPEYANYGKFSIKSDVFSFGVLFLEIISGQKNNSFYDGENIETIQSIAWRNWREGTALNVIDPALSDASRDDMMRCIHIALLCVQKRVVSRPTMALVDFMLNSFSTVTFPLPSQPAFLLQSDSNPRANESNSEATITELSPR